MNNLLTYKQVDLLSESIQLKKDELEPEPMQRKGKYHRLMRMVSFKFKPSRLFAREKKVTVWVTPIKNKIFDIESDTKLPFDIGDSYSKVEDFIEDKGADILRVRRSEGSS